MNRGKAGDRCKVAKVKVSWPGYDADVCCERESAVTQTSWREGEMEELNLLDLVPMRSILDLLLFNFMKLQALEW